MPVPSKSGPSDYAGQANSAVTANDVAAFQATMKQYGHNQDAIDAALSKAGYTAPDPTKPVPGEQPVAAGSRFSQNDIDEFVQSLHDANFDNDQIAAALRAQGLNLELAPPPPDPRSDAARDLDEQFPSPESEPIHLKLAMPSGTTEAELAQANIDGRAFIHQTQLPSNIGPSLVEMMSEVATRLAGMTPQARAEWRSRQEEITMRQAGGDAGIKAYLDKAAAGLGRAKDSQLWARMAQSGANFDATILGYLAAHGERVSIRKTL